MAIRVGINGFGRIGRQVYRAFREKYAKRIEVVAVNDVARIPRPMSHLFKYDSNYGVFPGDVEAPPPTASSLDGHEIKVSAEREPGKAPLEGTGVLMSLSSRPASSPTRPRRGRTSTPARRRSSSRPGKERGHHDRPRRQRGSLRPRASTTSSRTPPARPTGCSRSQRS